VLSTISRVLVSGATGFIGRHVLVPLLAAGLEVHAVGSRDRPFDGPPGVRWHHADLLAPEAPRALMRKIAPTHLLHLAWYVRPGSLWTAAANLDWLSASLRLLDAFADVGGRRVTMAGTCAEYSWQARTHCVEELTPTRPATLYGATKHGLNIVADAWARQVGVKLAWGRIFFIYGPHEHPDRLAASIALALLRGEEAACSHGRQVRDYLYAPDLGAAFVALLLSDVAGPVNVASGEPVRVGDLIGAIARAVGRPELVRMGARQQVPGEPDSLTAAVGRLREEVDWAPLVGLQEGAERTVNWWQRVGARTP
jgi:nucleoside-diphosphate-sugar epimerase